MTNKQRVLDTFLELLNTPSESRNERVICDLLKNKLANMGFVVTEDNTMEQTGCNAGNIYAILKGNPQIESIYLNAHMDTVEPTYDLNVIIEDGIIKTDGKTILGADDKSAVAAILEALEVIVENNLEHGDIEVVITVSEEANLQGAATFDTSVIQSKWGFAVDSGGQVGDLKIAAPSRAEFWASFKGKAAHAGVQPEKGVSAVYTAATAISKIPHGRIDFETTANIGVFQADSLLNVVNDEAGFKSEVRSFNPEKLQAQLDTMEQVCKQTAQEFGASVEIKSEILFKSFGIAEDHPCIQVGQEAAKRIGRDGKLFQAGGLSDANVFNGNGIPTPILTCGYSNPHGKNEIMPIEELNKLSDMLVAIVQVVAETKVKESALS